MDLGPHTVALLEAGFLTDEYGNETFERDWANPTRDDVTGCSVQPTGGDEYTVDREAVIVRYRAFLPGVHAVDSTARVEWNGDQYYLDGVEVWDFDQLPHTDLLMRKVTG